MKIKLNAGLGNYIPLSCKEVNLPERVTVSAVSNCDHLVLSVQSKVGVRQYDLDKEVDITDMCKDGYILMSLTGFKNGEKIAEWQVEKLHVSYVDGTIKPQPNIEYLEQQVKDLSEKTQTLTKAVQELYKMIKE